MQIIVMGNLAISHSAINYKQDPLAESPRCEMPHWNSPLAGAQGADMCYAFQIYTHIQRYIHIYLKARRYRLNLVICGVSDWFMHWAATLWLQEAAKLVGKYLEISNTLIVCVKSENRPQIGIYRMSLARVWGGNLIRFQNDIRLFNKCVSQTPLWKMNGCG